MLVSSIFSLFLLFSPGGELDDLPLLTGGIERISSYDLTEGDNDFMPLPRGNTLVLADIKTGGTIKRFYIKVDSDDPAHLRTLLLQIFWDDADQPSVECPLGDFFALGHARYYPVRSVPLITGNRRGLTCYFPMPFHKRALILLVNEGSGIDTRVTYQVDYQPGKPVEGSGYFHANYNQGHLFTGGGHYPVLRAEGRGKYVGLVLSVALGEEGWFGQGDERIYVDGSEAPSVQGTGLDDLFGSAFGFENGFCGPYFGTPVAGDYSEGSEFVGYRFYLRDPVTFDESIDVLLEHLGDHFRGDTKLLNHSRRDSYYSVAYWYQDKPAAPFAPLLSAPERVSGDRLFTIEGESMKVQGLTAGQVENHIAYGATVTRFTPKKVGDQAVFSVQISRNGAYRVSGFFTRSARQGTYRISLGDRVLAESIDFFRQEGGQGRWHVQRSDEVLLGTVELTAGLHTLTFENLLENEDSEGMLLELDSMIFRPVP